MGLTPPRPRRYASRRLTRIAWVLLVLVLLAGLADAVWWSRLRHWNELIRTGPLPSEGAGLPREVQFAQAHAQAASGALDAALTRYRALQDDTPLGLAARYNSANLLLRQAAELQASPQPGQAVPLIELAKEMYRDLLRTAPNHWDARYNLERAQRLLPDPEEIELAPADSKQDAERAATTMRGYSPGLP